MHKVIIATLVLDALASGAPTLTSTADPSNFISVPTSYTAGFAGTNIIFSAEGKAICIEGMVNVTASANNIKFNLEEPENNLQVTELLVEAFQVNSTLDERIVAGHNVVSGTYSIYSQLCYPRTSAPSTATIQFLIPGIGYDRNYWNFAPNYSFVDVAASHGYTTFSYDRPGTGRSSHPNPIQVMQLPFEIEVAHQLISKVRSGAIASQPFTSVVGVGHSYGSYTTLGLTAKYPADFDAAVLTGFSPDTSGALLAFATTDLVIASGAVPERFAHLSNGYLTANSIVGNQAFFFRAPGFDPDLLNLSESKKDTIAIGEFLTASLLPVAENFTGLVDIVNGENDLPNCHGNCLVPYNKQTAAIEKIFPNAGSGSDWYVGPGAGHGLNLHYAAKGAFEHIQSFVKKNGF
jgi:pimeloyl-ACP methyl ester carboxylesterase